MEQEKQTENISTLYDQLLELQPKLVTNFVPEQKELFLSGAIRNPNHEYDRLNAINFDKMQFEINDTGNKILSQNDLNPKHRVVYEEFIEDYKKHTRLEELAYKFKHAQDENERAALESEYMQLNIELYGEPTENTYRSILQEKISEIARTVYIEDSAVQIKDELLSLVEYNPDNEKIKRFSPSEDTVEWLHGVADTLYSGMLTHVPEQKTFTATEVQSIFTDIIKDEFGEAADGWKVDIEDAQVMNVKTSEKRVVIPEKTKNISYDKLKTLIVHELGVHLLRSVIGSETDILPLRSGLSEYYDSEEGLAVAMSQAFANRYDEAGDSHYITAGLTYYDKKDFRDVFEIKWRMTALNLEMFNFLTEDVINKAKNIAYNSVMRSLRGTDELPWFKDLSYYNGSADMWKYFEEIKGDDVKFMFVLMGKANPSNIKHERILYEARTL